jgi:hypothetical protein
MPKKTFYIKKEELQSLFITQNMSRKKVAAYYGCSEILIKKKCQEFGIQKPKHLENKNKERKETINCNWCGKEFETTRFRTINNKWLSKFCSPICSSDNRNLGETHRQAVRNFEASKRRARMKSATDSSANLDDIAKFYINARMLTEKTGIPHEVDHIVPIAKGGKHHQDNLQILTQEQNRRKNCKLCSEI